MIWLPCSEKKNKNMLSRFQLPYQHRASVCWQCRWCFTKYRSITAGRGTRSAVVAAVHTISHAYHGDASAVLCLSQMILHKCSKIQHILLIMVYPGATTS